MSRTVLGNKKPIGTLFYKSNGLTTLYRPGSNGTETTRMGLIASSFLPQSQITYRLNSSTAIPQNVTAAGSSQFDYILSKNINVHQINSVRLEITLQNNSGVDVQIAPTPFWFNQVAISSNSACAQPIWSQQPMDYIFQLMKYEEQEAVRILNESGFA